MDHHFDFDRLRLLAEAKSLDESDDAGAVRQIFQTTGRPNNALLHAVDAWAARVFDDDEDGDLRARAVKSIRNAIRKAIAGSPRREKAWKAAGGKARIQWKKP